MPLIDPEYKAMSKTANEKPGKDVYAVRDVMKKHFSRDDDVLGVDRKFLKETFTPEILGADSKLTFDLYKEAQRHNQRLLAGGKLAVGEEAYKVMNKKASYGMMRCKVPLNNDTVDYRIHREKSRRNPQTQETFTVPGYISTIYKMRGVKGTGETLKVNGLLAELAEEMLG